MPKQEGITKLLQQALYIPQPNYHKLRHLLNLTPLRWISEFPLGGLRMTAARMHQLSKQRPTHRTRDS